MRDLKQIGKTPKEPILNKGWWITVLALAAGIAFAVFVGRPAHQWLFNLVRPLLGQ